MLGQETNAHKKTKLLRVNLFVIIKPKVPIQKSRNDTI